MASGIVEHDGKFWIEDLPLGAGNNFVTLTAVDVGTNSAVTNFTVVKSSVELAITPLPEYLLHDPFVTVYGTINGSGHKIWVNGREVTNLIGNDWWVEGVPLNPGGTAIVQARAIPLTDNGGNGSGGSGGGSASFDDLGNPFSSTGTTTEEQKDRETQVIVTHYHKNLSWLSVGRTGFGWGQINEGIKWEPKQPGYWWQDDCHGSSGPFGDDFYFLWFNVNWGTNGTGTLYHGADRGPKAQVCGVHSVGGQFAYTAPTDWPGESCTVAAYRLYDLGGTAEKYDEVVARSSRTLYELHTGGKATSRRSNLFVMTGQAEGVGDPFWWEYASEKQAYAIPVTDVLLGSLGPLGSDGRLYTVLPDGKTFDVTPTVLGNSYYTYAAPVPNKHGLELVTPSGNPTNPPSWPNRFCFSADDPGVLTLNLVAVLTNNGPAWVLTNRVRFEADDIGSAQKVWSADNPDGRPVANGAELTATLYYVHLPTNNSDFGLKFARVLLDEEVHDQNCFWAFYPADVFNHPGPNPPPDGSQRKRPRNYFYYYMQTQAGAPTKTQYGPFYKGDEDRWGTSEFESWPPYTYFAAYSQTSRHPPGQYIPEPGVNGGTNLTYIDLFAWAARHEKAHHKNYNRFWGASGVNPQDDQDQPYGDHLPDLQEQYMGSEGGPYDPSTPDTHPTDQYPPFGQVPDQQRHNCNSIHAVEWTKEQQKASFEYDWAAPGKNWAYGP